MRYYKLLMDSSGDNDIVCHYENDYGIQQYDLKMGKKFDGWNEDFEFYYDVTEGEQATDYLANDMGWLVVSGKLKKSDGRFRGSSGIFLQLILERKRLVRDSITIMLLI